MAIARRIRGFKRWIKSHGIECSDALLLSTETDDSLGRLSIFVKALCDLKEGDVVAVIPKQSCLTSKTSAVTRLIEEAGLGGKLGLAVAVMYEKSLGPRSKWFQYLQILPPFEPIPLLWSPPEIDSLLSGTELHETVKEDQTLVYQDWKECIKPLLASIELNPDFFTVDEYFAAKSLVASRAFQIDEFHGFGMVPLADLFNHKTAIEDVHLTSVSSSSESDTDAENKERDDSHKNDRDEPINLDFNSKVETVKEISSPLETEATFMEMIIVKDVKAGAEVFNTYGHLGNAALLHRYGFTELDNPFDIVNIDLDAVVRWSLSLFPSRHSRRRVSLWRKLGYCGCVSQDTEYFEISFDGEPQRELLVLLNIMLVPEEEFHKLDIALSMKAEAKKTMSLLLLERESFLSIIDSAPRKKLLLTRGVRQALFSLADARESFYGPTSLEDDIRSLNECSHVTHPKLYHSLVLRISERRIIEKLRSFAAFGARNLRTASSTRNCRKGRGRGLS